MLGYSGERDYSAEYHNHFVLKVKEIYNLIQINNKITK